MLVIPMCDSRGNVLGVLQLINHLTGENFSGEVSQFPAKVESYLRALASQCGVVLRNLRMAEDLRQSRIETVKKFVKASEYHDTDTGGHIERMSRYSVLLYKELGFDESACEVMRLAAMLHDAVTTHAFDMTTGVGVMILGRFNEFFDRLDARLPEVLGHT